MTGWLGNKDILFHVLYGDDRQLITEMNHCMARRLYDITQCKCIVTMMNLVIDGAACETEKGGARLPVSLHTLQAMFFVFLNVDVLFKEYLCDIRNREMFAAVMCVAHSDKGREEHLEEAHKYFMVGCTDLQPAKGARFFTSLRKIVKQWMSMENMSKGDFVDLIKNEYLVS